MTHEETPIEGELPPADPAEFPQELQEALRRMSERGPVVDMGTGQTVAQDGRLTTDTTGADLVACNECARAIALGWMGAISRHPGPPGKPVCVLCGEGEAVHTPAQWFAITTQLVAARTRDGQRRSWRDDAVIGLGIRPGLHVDEG